MKYSCNYCNYDTDDFGNWSRHKKSKKHYNNSNELTKLTYTDSIMTPSRLRHDSTMTPTCHIKKNDEGSQKKKYNCEYCDKIYSKSSNLSRHLKGCMSKKHSLLENQFEIYKKEKDIEIKGKNTECQIKIMKEKLKALEEKNKTLENHIDTLKSENIFQKQLISSAGGMIQKSMNTMSYLLLNYNNAPQLQELQDYSIITKDNETLIKDLIHYHKKGKFDKYIGDFIVKQYKKDDPNSQTLWSSDVERLNYFIRELINNNKDSNNTFNASATKIIKTKINWVIDKQGIKVRKSIIDPLLDYIYGIGLRYLHEKNKQISELEIEESNNVLSDMYEIGTINCGIKNKSLACNINKYIAPHFYLNKEIVTK